ncbi:MAG: ImmA/IrrE family metallo-endopeptidase, partial [Pontiellaceae bacterium]|nr:ImmA/IrrE family metallo-endopeptidase [Pontiellaceae bacterium]
PDHYEEERQSRSEHMADNFAAALIMPYDEFYSRWKQFDESNLKKWLEETASELAVSAHALFWRLVNLGELKKADLPEHLEAPFHDQKPRPAIYSEKFVRMMKSVFERGDVSVRKVATMLDCSFEQLEDAFASYNLEAPFEL